MDDPSTVETPEDANKVAKPVGLKHDSVGIKLGDRIEGERRERLPVFYSTFY